MDNRPDTDDMISALADGQLRGQDFAQAVAQLSVSAQARATWHAYHVIGDVLRSPELAPVSSPAAFMSRLQASLQNETVSPANVVAIESIAASGRPARTTSQFGTEAQAANASTFRWKLLAGVASLAAVAAVTWGVAGGGVGQAGAGAQLAQAPAAQPSAAQPPMVLAGNERQAMIRDPRLDELLAAHRQAGGASALQMPAGFLRNATFEGPGR
ncbi:MAG: sigma-E factor negative regulatory protein [Ramlibacter sp.]|nr:sigma-E factor negative regulatory protein [Ramlibacter sp.]